MKLIDKAAVVAYIKSCISDIKISQKVGFIKKRDANNRIIFFKSILSFINTLEMKDVDLDSNIRAYLTNHFNVYEDGVLQSKKSNNPLNTYDIIKVAKYFFELGIKAQKGE